MRLHIAPGARTGENSAVTSMRAIQALDLAQSPEHRALWHPASRRAGLLAPSPPAGSGEGGPEGEGWASPMGYWLTSVADPSSLPPDALRITFSAPVAATALVPATPPKSAPGRRPAQSVRIKAPNNSDGDVLLTLDPRSAHVVATPGAWTALAEPVLLAVCQYWRFCAVDAELDRLTELARGDLDDATLPGPASLLRGRRHAATGRAVRALLVDLAHFEGPLTDPLPYVAHERSAALYRTLVEKLQLEPWCELIDERCEVVEDTYEAVTEKLFEFKNFAWEALLEALIIVILVGELALTAWDIFSAE